MASKIPHNFLESGEAAIASYDYFDIEENTGVIIFLGALTEDNAVKTYYLSRTSAYSSEVFTEGTGSGGVEKVLDIDFDIAFALPKNVKGKLRVLIPVVVGDETTVSKNGTVYAVVKVRHWDGSSETEVASNTKSKVTTDPGSLDTTQDVLNVEVDVATVKHFKKDETLRITVEIWAATQGGNNIRLALMHDPKDRLPVLYTAGADVADFITSIMEVHVPFRLDL